MTDVTEDQLDPEVPDGWDHLPSADDEATPLESLEEVDQQPDGLVIPLIAGSWGDLALVLGLCATALIALKVSGHGAPFSAAWWALALAAMWWLVAAGVLVTVRQATPGMLLAGVRFEENVPPNRVAPVLLVGLVMCATLGLPAAVGPMGWPLTAAAGTGVTSAARDLQ